MKKKVRLCVGLIVLSLVIISTPGLAYQIEPQATKSMKLVLKFENWKTRLTDRASPLISSFITDSVHERIAHHIYGCNGDDDVCSKPKNPHNYAPDAVIAGTQWNDNPPFVLAKTSMKDCAGEVIQLPKHSVCWAKLLKDGEKRAKNGEIFDASSNAVLVLRVHFGDLQFLHSMASRDAEDPSITRQRILMWAEFAYRVATGYFKRDTVLNQTGIEGMKELFGNRGWTVQQIFTMGDPTYRKEQDIRDLAFGSLLHMISDSFADSHTDREEPTGAYCKEAPAHLEPGRIKNFHAYGRQDHEKHAEKDTQDAVGIHLATAQPNVVDVGRTLLSYYKEGKSWVEVKGYLECVFSLDDAVTASGPGDLFLPD